MQEIIKILEKFVQDRNWSQFHTGSELVRALSIEVAELNELFLFYRSADISRIKEELADVFIYSLLLANRFNLDIKRIILDKIEINAKKYPVSKFKDSNKKYNQ